MSSEPHPYPDDLVDLEVLEIEEWLHSMRQWRAALERGQSAQWMEA